MRQRLWSLLGYLLLLTLVVGVTVPAHAGTSNRTGSENLTLAITSRHGVPCRHGNPACIITRGVGTDPT
jgi:hypothetical protein